MNMINNGEDWGQSLSSNEEARVVSFLS